MWGAVRGLKSLTHSDEVKNNRPSLRRALLRVVPQCAPVEHEDEKEPESQRPSLIQVAWGR